MSNSDAGDYFAPQNIEMRRKRDGLILQRARILQEMDGARNPRYRKLLEEMLSDLERRLSSCV